MENTKEVFFKKNYIFFAVTLTSPTKKIEIFFSNEKKLVSGIVVATLSLDGVNDDAGNRASLLPLILEDFLNLLSAAAVFGLIFPECSSSGHLLKGQNLLYFFTEGLHCRMMTDPRGPSSPSKTQDNQLPITFVCIKMH